MSLAISANEKDRSFAHLRCVANVLELAAPKKRFATGREFDNRVEGLLECIAPIFKIERLALQVSISAGASRFAQLKLTP